MKILIGKLTKLFLVLTIGVAVIVSPGAAGIPILPVMIGSTATRLQPFSMPGGAVSRRVNIPFFSSAVNVSQSAIFWFGKNETYQTIPGRNYVDVRIAYSPDGLYLRATVIDYYLWYKESANISDDLTSYDALAIYLDTGHDRALTPKADDYYFLVGEHGDTPGQDTPDYRRQARGTGTSWDPTWSSTWSDYSGWQWYCEGDNPCGPNNNGGHFDYGWVGGGTIPWSAFGLSGPPAEGTVWGFGVLLYDQDQSPNNPVIQENWPETLSPNQPNTWGELHFGLASYTPPPAVASGSTFIRAASPEDNTVEDAWMGGGGWCYGGHEGHAEENHGDDPNLFVGSEIQPTHFPCYNKFYLRFALAGLPPGKVILSATLTLHHWGGANVDTGTSSYVWLSSVTDPWQEMTIHWNNAPLAQENFSMTRIPPKVTPLVWPGDPYTWDATRVVAEAYAAGHPVDFALYDSTTGIDSSKYLTASEIGLGDGTPNWDIEGRPRLDIVWGDPVARVTKRAEPERATHGSIITYTLGLLGAGQSLSLSDSLPGGLSHPISMNTTSGQLTYNSAARQLTWNGAPASGQAVLITFTVTVTQGGPRMVSNTATLTLPGGTSNTSTANVCVDCYAQWLPLVWH